MKDATQHIINTINHLQNINVTCVCVCVWGIAYEGHTLIYECLRLNVYIDAWKRTHIGYTYICISIIIPMIYIAIGS